MAQLTPQNQLDSLPLLTAASVGQPGEFVLIGGQINRYWSPQALAMQDVGLIADATGGFIIGPSTAIDARGCNNFLFVLTKKVNVAANNQVQTMQINVQWANGAGTFPPADQGLGFPAFGMGVASLVTAVYGVAPLHQPYSQGFSNRHSIAGAGGGTGVIVGDNFCRFFGRQTVGPAVAGLVFDLEIVGAS